MHYYRWKPFDPSRNWPDLGSQFIEGEKSARFQALGHSMRPMHITSSENDSDMLEDEVANDKRDLDWAAVLKRTFESYIRGERPNMYGEWLVW